MERLVASGALIALVGTFFSLAYAGSRQFYHLAGARPSSPVSPQDQLTASSNRGALLLVTFIGLVFGGVPRLTVSWLCSIFLICVSYVLVLLAFIRLPPGPAVVGRAPYRAIGGQSLAATGYCVDSGGHGVLLPAPGRLL